MTKRSNPDAENVTNTENVPDLQANGKTTSSKNKSKRSKESINEANLIVDSKTTLIDEPSIQSPAPSQAISSVAKIVVAVAVTAVLGVTATLGIILVVQSETLPNITKPTPPAAVASPPVTANGQETSEPASFDDGLRDWNLKAAGSISPLISQLARAPRNTLGGQIALCKEQRVYLEAVLELPTPPNKAVSIPFKRWREALLKTLDSCNNRTPSGNDADDIAIIVREIMESESYFASFLEAQQPFLDVQFQSNPGAFEK